MRAKIKNFAKEFRDYDTIYKLFCISVAIMIILFLFSTVSSAFIIHRYDSYDTEATARITDLEHTESSVHAINSHKYRAVYEFSHAGKTYTGQTSWMSSYMKTGEKIPVRFDSANPQQSMLQTEKRNTVTTWIAALAVTAFGLLWFKFG